MTEIDQEQTIQREIHENHENLVSLYKNKSICILLNRNEWIPLNYYNTLSTAVTNKVIASLLKTSNQIYVVCKIFG